MPVDPHPLQQTASRIVAKNEDVAPHRLDVVNRSRHAVAQGSAVGWVKMRSVTTTTLMMKTRMTTISRDFPALSAMNSTMTSISKMTSKSLICQLLTLRAVVETAGPIAVDLKADLKAAEPKVADPSRSPVKTLHLMNQHPRVGVAVVANANR